MKIAVIGCGVMGSAFARKLAIEGHDVYLCDRSLEKAKSLGEKIGAHFTENPSEAAESSEWILLAIKPKDLRTTANQLKSLSGKILFSILSGTTVSELKGFFPKCQIIRAMPNLALIHDESVIALVEHDDLEKEAITKTNQLIEKMGMIIWTSEDQIDPITALAGSGPAFIIAIVEALIDGGIMMGIRAQDAQKIAEQMVKGAISLIEHHEGHPAEVRWKISAPKGTTISGLHAFEEANIRAGMINTLLATYEKAKDMQ